MEEKSFNRWTGIQIALLAATSLLGMAINLFGTPPTSYNLSLAYEPSTWVFVPRVLLGIAILVISIKLFAASFKMANSFSKKASLAAMLLVMLALVSGFAFVITNSDIFSYAMPVGFIGSLVFYIMLFSRRG